MQRKLVKYEVFEKITENSLNAAQFELLESMPILSAALKTGPLHFHSFTANKVIFETVSGNYVHATYKINPLKGVLFENIEEVVIDEESHREKRLSVLNQMVDALLEDNSQKADELFGAATKLVREQYRKSIFARNNAKVNETIRPSKGGIRKIRENLVLKARGVKKKIDEWAHLTKNIFNYVEFVEYGRILDESTINKNAKGDVVSVQIPTAKLRNEGKVLMAQWKTLKADVKIMRENAMRLANDRDFCTAIADLKRHNNHSDNSALEESINSIISRWPNLIYLTQEELAGMIGHGLGQIGVTNYDDKTCEFMAEGILRTAHSTYVDRVNRIMSLAKASVQEGAEDQYPHFQQVVKSFFATLDESTVLEAQVFVDLYNATLEVRRAALESDLEALRREASDYAGELKSIIDGESEASLEIATQVATWLHNIIETNLEGMDWSVEKDAHISINGDHPAMMEKAKKGYSPASDFSGDWGDPAPQIDGEKMGYKTGAAEETRNRSWGNKGGNEVWPALNNPYVPKAGEYTMKGEPGVDKNHDAEGEAQWQSGDTWPNLNNPYVPKATKTHVSDANRVDTATNP